jgi:hypothetical protein
MQPTKPYRLLHIPYLQTNAMRPLKSNASAASARRIMRSGETERGWSGSNQRRLMAFPNEPMMELVCQPTHSPGHRGIHHGPYGEERLAKYSLQEICFNADLKNTTQQEKYINTDCKGLGIKLDLLILYSCYFHCKPRA